MDPSTAWSDSLFAKVFLAIFSALLAVFFKSIHEAWQKSRAWNLLSATPVYLADGWNIQIKNGSDLPIISSAAYLGILHGEWTLPRALQSRLRRRTRSP